MSKSKLALFIGWGEGVRGREQQAGKVFAEAMAFWQRMQAEGLIESFDAAILEPHGGELRGFLLVRGEQDNVLKVWRSEDFARLSIRTRLVVEHFGVVPAVTGAELQASMTQWVQEASAAG